MKISFETEISNRMKVKSGELKATATIAVLADKTLLLMGRRRDNDKWTLPGGGLNPHESPLMGALRELREEAGVDAPSLKYVGAEVVDGSSGRSVCVYCYTYTTRRIPTSSANDPDKEVANWQWVDIEHGLPEWIAENLHNERNVLLIRLGLLK